MPTKYSLPHSSLPPVTKANDPKIQEEDAVVHIEVAESVIDEERPYAGMSPEDVDRFANTPFWNNFRRISLGIFFCLWFSLFVISIVLIVVYPRCGKPPRQEWWHRSTFYQVFVPSFQDSNGDGVGDIRGLQSRLADLQFMGVDAVVLSPLFQQEGVPMRRFSEDLITDFQRLDSRMGTDSDLQALVAAAKEKGIRLVLEFPVNHVSRNHSWFQDCLRGHANVSNFFVWSSCTPGGALPNNWISREGGPAWEFAAAKSACYYHSGSRDQPDLNWRSAVVRDLMERSISSWLARGFDGVLLTRATDLFEDYDLRDEPFNASHVYTRDLPETVDAIKRLRAAVHKQNESLVLMAALESNLNTFNRYVTFEGAIVADVAISRRPMEVLQDGSCRAECLWKVLSEMDSIVARPAWPAFLLGDRRSAKRLRVFLERPNVAMMLYGVLPGSFVTYYGDELGLSQTLAPMRWSNTSNGGFTNASSPWQPVVGRGGAVETFDDAKSRPSSGVQLLKAIQKIRKENNAMQIGRLHLVKAEGSVLAVRREFDGTKSFLAIANFGTKDLPVAELGLAGLPEIPSELQLITDTLSTSAAAASDTTVKSAEVSIKGGQGLLFQWDYVIKEHL